MRVKVIYYLLNKSNISSNPGICGSKMTQIWFDHDYTLLNVANRASYTMDSGGLLWIVPFVILAIMPIKSKKMGRFRRIIWLSPILYLVIVCVVTPTVSGIHWGPRFILQALPLMFIIATIRAQRWWKRYSIAKPVIIVLVLITVCNQFYSYDILHINIYALY